jgi:hypothetical protein
MVPKGADAETPVGQRSKMTSNTITKMTPKPPLG